MVKQQFQILLENENEKCYVEIKSVSLRIGNELAFPDAVTTRGTKHLNELISMIEQGNRAVMLYIIQRTDKANFRIANEIDPKYYETFLKAREKGVEVLVYQSSITLEEIKINTKVEF